jgi:hypothetical protein
LIGGSGSAACFGSTVHEILPKHLEINPSVKFQPPSDRKERQSPTHLFLIKAQIDRRLSRTRGRGIGSLEPALWC